MTSVVHVQDECLIESKHNTLEEFKKDVREGLSQPAKQVSAKYFYDAVGSELFNNITQIPDYYLTQCELEILEENKKNISDMMAGEAFNLVELGPGAAIKTQLIVQQFLKDKLTFRYTPIDISLKFLVNITKQFHHDMPGLTIAPLHADYLQGLAWQSDHSHRRNMVLFLGSSIGNFGPEATQSFLKNLWQILHKDDLLLFGFDLKKDIQTLLRAYDDAEGVTRDFNLNLLQRINRELGGNFDINKFSHYATYNVHTNAMESYLISMQRQTVAIEALKKSFSFEAIEPIHTECSYKYDLNLIRNMAKENGFTVIKNFTDSKNYFVNSLWRVKK